MHKVVGCLDISHYYKKNNDLEVKIFIKCLDEMLYLTRQHVDVLPEDDGGGGGGNSSRRSDPAASLLSLEGGGGGREADGGIVGVTAGPSCSSSYPVTIRSCSPASPATNLSPDGGGVAEYDVIGWKAWS